MSDDNKVNIATEQAMLVPTHDLRMKFQPDRVEYIKGEVEGVPVSVIGTNVSQNGGDPEKGYDYEVRVGIDTAIIDSPGVYVGDTKVSINGRPVTDKALAEALQSQVGKSIYFQNDGSDSTNMHVFASNAAAIIGINIKDYLTPIMTQEEGHGLLNAFYAAKQSTERGG